MEKDLTYEEAYEELEKLVDSMENDDLTLEESLKKYKRGIELYKYLNKILNTMEGEIKILLEDKENGITESDFDLET